MAWTSVSCNCIIQVQSCLGCQRAAVLRGILRRENPMAANEPAMVLKWFYSLSHRKTFVGGKCALPSALLVYHRDHAIFSQCSPLQALPGHSDYRYITICDHQWPWTVEYNSRNSSSHKILWRPIVVVNFIFVEILTLKTSAVPQWASKVTQVIGNVTIR